MSARATPRPFIIEHTGRLVDRATETPIGRVWLVSGDGPKAGWRAENAWTRHGPGWTRWWIAWQAWEEWDRRVGEAMRERAASATETEEGTGRG